MQYDGSYVAVPVQRAPGQLAVDQPGGIREGRCHAAEDPRRVLCRCREAQGSRFRAVAHGGQPWQDGTVFEGFVLSILGPDDYHKAFVEAGRGHLTGDKMVQAFTALKKLRDYLDADAAGR